MLDDLDSWFQLHLSRLNGLLAATREAVLIANIGAYMSPDSALNSTGAHMTRILERMLRGTDGTGSVLKELPEQLYTAGTALCNALPVPWLCNNPACSNLAGESEAQLVGGKSCVCAGCKVARYCSRACQVKHWKHHKPACKRLAARAAGAAPPVPPAASAHMQQQTAGSAAAATGARSSRPE